MLPAARERAAVRAARLGPPGRRRYATLRRCPGQRWLGHWALDSAGSAGAAALLRGIWSGHGTGSQAGASAGAASSSAASKPDSLADDWERLGFTDRGCVLAIVLSLLLDGGWFVPTVCTAGCPLNRSWFSRRRCRKPSRGRRERFKRGSPTHFDVFNSKVRSIAMAVPRQGADLPSAPRHQSCRMGWSAGLKYSTVRSVRLAH